MKTKETLLKEGFVDCSEFMMAADYPEVTTKMFVILWNRTSGKIETILKNSAGSYFELDNGYIAYKMDIKYYKILDTVPCEHCGHEKENPNGLCVKCGKFPPYKNSDATLVSEQLSNNSRGIAIKWLQSLASLEKTRICDTNTEIVGHVRRYETLSGTEIEKLYNLQAVNYIKNEPKRQYTEFNEELFSKYIAKFKDTDKVRMYNFLKKTLNIWGGE